MSNKYKSLELKIEVKFKDQSLLENVFIHRSYLNEHKKLHLASNERLEFLGDSVLSLITSVYLFRNFPYLKEGDYTEIKSAIVKTESLAEAALAIGLNNYLLLSKGEEKSGGKTNKNILADCFEALIAAIFLDQSFEKAYAFVSNFLFRHKLSYLLENNLYLSYKSRLQEIIQAKYKKTPLYTVLEEKGPEHKESSKSVFLLTIKSWEKEWPPQKKKLRKKPLKKLLKILVRCDILINL